MASKKRPLPEATRELQAKKSQLVNKLLDSQRSPECLTEITKRNATDSPLLHLPGEIRNKIWEYASSGEVELHQHANRMSFTRKHDALPAFHLPRVCRQIYGETARLAYSQSTFALPCNNKCKDCPLFVSVQWNLRQNKDAITAIEPEAWYIQEYVLFQNLLVGCRINRKQVGLRNKYSSLRCMYVSKSAMECSVEEWRFLRAAESLEPLGPENLNQWRRLIEGAIRYIEGEDMEVIFRD